MASACRTLAASLASIEMTAGPSSSPVCPTGTTSTTRSEADDPPLIPTENPAWPGASRRISWARGNPTRSPSWPSPAVKPCMPGFVNLHPLPYSAELLSVYIRSVSRHDTNARRVSPRPPKRNLLARLCQKHQIGQHQLAIKLEPFHVDPATL
jgi:hypothetical protein